MGQVETGRLGGMVEKRRPTGAQYVYFDPFIIGGYHSGEVRTKKIKGRKPDFIVKDGRDLGEGINGGRNIAHHEGQWLATFELSLDEGQRLRCNLNYDEVLGEKYIFLVDE